MAPDAAPEEPSDLEIEPAEPEDQSDLDFSDMPCTDDGGGSDDSRWEAFIPDDDESDPQPDPGDFWVENCRVIATFFRPRWPGYMAAAFCRRG